MITLLRFDYNRAVSDEARRSASGSEKRFFITGMVSGRRAV